MQCYAPPGSVKPPEYDYASNAASFDKVDKDYIAAVKQALVEDGARGPLTGEVVTFPIADGRAYYMVFEAPGKRPAFGLVHLPLLDAYDIPDAHMRGLRKRDILEMIKQRKRMEKLFSKK